MIEYLTIFNKQFKMIKKVSTIDLQNIFNESFLKISNNKTDTEFFS